MRPKVTQYDEVTDKYKLKEAELLDEKEDHIEPERNIDLAFNHTEKVISVKEQSI
mgnify:CR=1 FL=1